MTDNCASKNDAVVKVIGSRRKQRWVSDEAVTNCHQCAAEFTWLTRRHHCRACGEVFCYKCCSNFDVLPRSVENFPSRKFVARSTEQAVQGAETPGTPYS